MNLFFTEVFARHPEVCAELQEHKFELLEAGILGTPS
jgi:hypothetical protein